MNAVFSAKSSHVTKLQRTGEKNSNLNIYSWRLRRQYNQWTFYFCYVFALTMYSQVIKSWKSDFWRGAKTIFLKHINHSCANFMYMLEGYHRGICKLREVEKEHNTDLLLGTTILIVVSVAFAIVTVFIIIFIMWVLLCCVCDFSCICFELFL